MSRAFSHGMIDAWRRQIAWITLEEAIILLKHLGAFHADKIIICKGGQPNPTNVCARKLAVKDLLEQFSSSEFCINIRPIYFTGGPLSEKRYKGTLVTLLLDRILLMSHEKGCAFALRTVKYARSFGPTSHIKRDAASSFTYSI